MVKLFRTSSRNAGRRVDSPARKAVVLTPLDKRNPRINGGGFFTSCCGCLAGICAFELCCD
ncbi:hypothetical protein IWW55_006680 [Coemansia sp. RSA 2706]|nr:hypothetical protein IWW55_006680 [Coemansia sp. RSA 2706]KAJ2298061.1 hypothetical protein IWW54_006694 [Coemansia sp. RSA 2705]KAJ2304609.1 hypothetical protein IWW52_006570 [Coemansia sp. RSA 2704]KAJ2313945.1 hypothetical protein IWW51_006047 [Coemansia sp. RSA 2702]KAJ2710918.1 hypothetical protein H4R23_006482 [Coemansia sp. Cherry 401B]